MCVQFIHEGKKSERRMSTTWAIVIWKTDLKIQRQSCISFKKISVNVVNHDQAKSIINFKDGLGNLPIPARQHWYQETWVFFSRSPKNMKGGFASYRKVCSLRISQSPCFIAPYWLAGVSCNLYSIMASDWLAADSCKPIGSYDRKWPLLNTDFSLNFPCNANLGINELCCTQSGWGVYLMWR